MNKMDYEINNLPATKEEWLVYLYLEELKDNGFIEEINFQPESFKLFDGLPKKFYKDKQLKTKVKRTYAKRQYLINPHVYTPDFHTIWNNYKLDLHQTSMLSEFNTDITFISNLESKVLTNNEIHRLSSYIEVKPSFDQNNMTRMFTSHIQPWIWEKYNMYIQLIKPLELFKNTFVPKAVLHEFYYKKAGKWGKKGDKKYKWEYKTLTEYLNKN